MGEKQRVCVTGAGGYVASWLIKLLLSNGYTVHGTLRDPGGEKNAHLKKLENAAESLRLFRTNLLDYEGLCDAMAGCVGVFHAACPVPYDNLLDPEVEMIEPAVTGTRNVLNACLKADVKKVVVVSSISAIFFNTRCSKGEIVDEKCWSDKDYCKSAEVFLCLLSILSCYSLCLSHLYIGMVLPWKSCCRRRSLGIRREKWTQQEYNLSFLCLWAIAATNNECQLLHSVNAPKRWT